MHTCVHVCLFYTQSTHFLRTKLISCHLDHIILVHSYLFPVVLLLLQREITRLQEIHEADLHHLRNQLEEQVSANQWLATELREKEERMREMEETHRQREEELLTQLQQKHVELGQGKNSMEEQVLARALLHTHFRFELL